MSQGDNITLAHFSCKYLNINQTIMENKKVMNRGLVVVGAILIQLALGAIYAWSVFTPSLISEGWAKADTQWVFAIGLASFAVFMVFSGKRLNTVGPQKLTIIGVILSPSHGKTSYKSLQLILFKYSQIFQVRMLLI